jgi:hypothetical protein
MTVLSRLPLMLRALVLVPLLAAGLDQARVSFICPPGAQSCLGAASSGTLGTVGVVLMILYMLGIAALVGYMARGRSSLWIVATAGLWAALGGQAVIADALDTSALIGGGWLSMLAFGAAAGALLALALRTVRRALKLRAPDLVVRIEEIVHPGARLAAPPAVRPARRTRDRAPPAFA